MLFHACRSRLRYSHASIKPWSCMHAGRSRSEGKENGGPDKQAVANGVPPARGFKRERSEGLAALLDSPDVPTGRAGPYSIRRQLAAAAAGKPMSQKEPSLAHLAASNSADLGAVTHAVSQARRQQGGASKADKPGRAGDIGSETKGADNSPKGRATAAQEQQPFSGFAPSGSGGGQQAQSGGSDPKFLSPFSQHFGGMDPMYAFAHLPEGLRIQLQAPGGEDMSRTNSIVQVNAC